ncbi:MAG TPA: hypothetical protein VHA10_13125 [Hypericibacter adhaerens]|uniref:hypothetical protein n=1 Tax=Hypericibacter adhaerens TaxID=2602016 RepID=UPI002C674515|nr:hypothetical protein [Hypericibacter adhaerens]HWA44147.1 hypothetical protein [Hypericibacter adhaerens]
MDERSICRMLGGAILAGMLTWGNAAVAAPQITVPACDVLKAWSATVVPTDTYTVAPALPLPKALADEALLPVFGVTALSWTGEDIKAASGALTACYREAKKAGDKPAMDALGVANAAVAKTLGQTLAAVAKARQAVESQRPAIAGLPDTAELDRGLAALIDADPAKPNLQAAAGLPREITGPLVYIAKFLPYLPDGDRQHLMAELSDRRATIQAAAGQAMGQDVAAAPATADGVVTLMKVRQRIAAMVASDELTAIDGQAATRAEEIRAGLRQATPAGWVPPDCIELYRWSGAADARQGVTLGNQSTYTAFLDERVVPVFGISLAVWGDEDLTRFQTLRAVCQATWRAMPGAATISNPPADAPELLKLAAKGAWIDTADPQIAQARTAIKAYSAGLEALAAVETRIAALPDTSDSLPQLYQLANDPAQQSVDQARRQSFQAAVAAKQKAINARALTAAMDGLGQVQVASLGDLAKLVNYWGTASMTIADPNDRQRFGQAAEQVLDEDINRLLPDFKAKLDEMPATLAGLGKVRTAVLDLTGVSETEKAPPFQPMHAAIHERSAAIIEALHQENCTALLKELDIGGSAAEQLVWDGKTGTKLGVFVCNLTESGSPVHEYAGGGLLSGDQKLKATLAMGGLQTLWLHKAEVAQGQEDMLVGFKMADANQERPISVEEWAMFTAMATGGQFVTPEICDAVMSKPEDQLTIGDKMTGVACAQEVLNGSWGFQ